MYVALKQLRVQYAGQSQAAVDDVSCGLRAGQIGVLIGPSGCGKTSLLRALAGLEDIAAGSIEVNGQVVSSPGRTLPPEQRQIGMVFQDYALFPHLDVGQNVAFGIHHWPAAERRTRVGEVLELVGLGEVRRRHPHELSGGQQQRVALARALAPRPRLLLLDEPFSNLDVDLRERLAQELRSILNEAGATALFVTHDQMEAFAIGDLIGVMHQGRLHQWADAYSLYHRPATRFVADFIGHGVFMPAEVALRQDGAPARKYLVTPLGELDGLSPQDQQRLQVGPCDLLLRADDIVHDDHAPLQACILGKAFRGSEFLYTLELPTGESVLAHVPSHHDHRVGERIGIRMELDHVVAFARQ